MRRMCGVVSSSWCEPTRRRRCVPCDVVGTSDARRRCVLTRVDILKPFFFNDKDIYTVTW